MLVSDTEYQVLSAAANDSASYWMQAQEYRRELMETRNKLDDAHAATRVLFTLLALASIAGIILGVYR